MSLVDGCDPSAATCGPPPVASNVVTLDPVVIEGDPGVQALVRRHAADQCLDEKGSAVLSCAVAALAATKAIVTASTGVGWPVAVLEASIASLNAANCARVIVAYEACVDKHEARAEAAVTCEAEGGTLVVNAQADELVCLVER